MNLDIKPTIASTNQNYIYRYKEADNVFDNRINFTQSNLCTSEIDNSRSRPRNVIKCVPANQVIIPIF